MNNGGRNPDSRFIGGKGRTSSRNQVMCDVIYQVNPILTSGGTSMAQRMLTPANHFPPDEINLPKIIPCKPMQKPGLGTEERAKLKPSMPPPPQPPPLCLRTGSTLSGNNAGLYGGKAGNSSDVFIIRTKPHKIKNRRPRYRSATHVLMSTLGGQMLIRSWLKIDNHNFWWFDVASM